jgi:DNA-binding transcriptional LysR family regulator
MNIERLKYFSNLATTLNYTETAEHFFTTQGNISKNIIALEKELNITLFSREHRKITLTDAGKTILPYAQKILWDYTTLQNVLLPYQDSSSIILRLSAIPVMVNYNITGLIAEFHQNYPGIKMEVREVESISLLKELDEGICDIVYMRLFELDSIKYEKIMVAHDQFAIVLPSDHPLSTKTVIQLKELKNENFFQLDKTTQLIQQFYSLCHKAGFEPNVAYTGTRIENILDFVSKGMGVSLMMQNSIKPLHHTGTVVIPLDITMESELAFIRLKQPNNSLGSTSFWKYLTHKFGKN